MNGCVWFLSCCFGMWTVALGTPPSSTAQLGKRKFFHDVGSQFPFLDGSFLHNPGKWGILHPQRRGYVSQSSESSFGGILDFRNVQNHPQIDDVFWRFYGYSMIFPTLFQWYVHFPSMGTMVPALQPSQPVMMLPPALPWKHVLMVSLAPVGTVGGYSTDTVYLKSRCDVISSRIYSSKDIKSFVLCQLPYEETRSWPPHFESRDGPCLLSLGTCLSGPQLLSMWNRKTATPLIWSIPTAGLKAKAERCTQIWMDRRVDGQMVG